MYNIAQPQLEEHTRAAVSRADKSRLARRLLHKYPRDILQAALNEAELLKAFTVGIHGALSAGLWDPETILNAVPHLVRL